MSHADLNDPGSEDGRSRELKHKGKGPRETQRWTGGQDLEENAEESVLPRPWSGLDSGIAFGGVWSAVRKAR